MWQSYHITDPPLKSAESLPTAKKSILLLMLISRPRGGACGLGDATGALSRSRPGHQIMGRIRLLRQITRDLRYEAFKSIILMGRSKVRHPPVVKQEVCGKIHP